LDRHKGFERVEAIKAAAVPRDQRADAALPSPQVLLSRLRTLADVLVQKVAALDAAQGLLDALTLRLTAVAEAPEGSGTGVREVLAWLEAERRGQAEHPQTDDHAQLIAKDTFLRIMAASVKIIPRGHEFFVEGTESILDASVRAGLHLAYGCYSGNCGACKARLLSGEVWKTREHDFVLSEREKQMGYILTCSNTAVTDLVLEASEALRVADLPLQEIRAGVRKVEPLGDDLLLLHVQTPRTQTLRFMAGQRARLTLEDGAAAELPIASCPCNARHLHFFVRRRRGDPFCEQVFGRDMHHGQLITVKGPSGRFVLDEESPEPAVFIALGDGIAPIKSLIEHAVSIDIVESYHLYWMVAAADAQHQANWCRAMRDSLDNFAYTPLADSNPAEAITRILADHRDLDRRRIYVAGPSVQVEAVARGLESAGVPAGNLAAERLDSFFR
jgi:CDP-4-dehydro-6-deoxyglucose reductase